MQSYLPTPPPPTGITIHCLGLLWTLLGHPGGDMYKSKPEKRNIPQALNTLQYNVGETTLPFKVTVFKDIDSWTLLIRLQIIPTLLWYGCTHTPVRVYPQSWSFLEPCQSSCLLRELRLVSLPLHFSVHSESTGSRWTHGHCYVLLQCVCVCVCVCEVRAESLYCCK